MSDASKRVERAVELLVYAPIGAGLCAIDAAPSLADTFVNRARREFDRRHDQVSRRVTTVRSMGQVAVAFGVPMVRQRANAIVANRSRPASTTSTSPRTATVTRPTAPLPTSSSPLPNDALGSDKLPIPGYDALSASQVVERLTGLAGPELDAVHAYEVTHRQRRTILGKIEQLAG